VKTGLIQVGEFTLGFHEHRFVPTNWVSPFPHHCWYVVDVPGIVARWRKLLHGCDPVTWHGHDGVPSYTAEVSYDERVRPVLVCVGGFR
jgi:hypothetical protein